MLHTITWQQYFTTIISLLIIYYIIIGLRFFKWEVLNVLGIKRIESGLFSQESLDKLQKFSSNERDEINNPGSPLEIDTSTMMQSLSDEVRAYLNGTATLQIDKEEISDSMKKIISKYPELRTSYFSADLKKIVMAEINLRYPHLLNPEDFDQICN